MFPLNRYSKETLENWQFLALIGIVALSVMSGLLVPLIERSYLYKPFETIVLVSLYALSCWWWVADAWKIGFPLDWERYFIRSLIISVPPLGVLFYIFLSRGLRGGAPIAAKTVLFVLLVCLLFETSRQFSANVLSNR